MDLNDIIESMGDYTTDRDRPFTGQSHTDQGERGKTEVKGIRFRDLADCVARAIVDSTPPDRDQDGLELDTEQNRRLAELRPRVEDGTLNYNDLYRINWNDMSPVALIQNVCTRVEKEMDIYPNMPDDDQ